MTILEDIISGLDTPTLPPPVNPLWSNPLYDPDEDGSWGETEQNAPGSIDLMQLSSLGGSPFFGQVNWGDDQGGWAGTLPMGIGEESAAGILGAGYSAGDFLYPQEAAGGGWAGGWNNMPSGGGGGGSNIEWILGDYDVGGQGPDWWRPFTVKDSAHYSNPAVSATLMMNALIGSGALSDEDSRSMAKQLYATWGSHEQNANPWDLYSTKFGETRDFGGGGGETGGMGPPILPGDYEGYDAETRGETGPGDYTSDKGTYDGTPYMTGSFNPMISEHQAALGQTGPGIIGGEQFSRDRSEQVLNALSMMREATVGGNVHEFGPGYQYLQEVAGTLGEAGTADTRAKRQQILGALDPMLAMSQGGELGAFSGMAQALASPFYTNLPPQTSRTQSGDYQFGRQSKDLFF